MVGNTGAHDSTLYTMMDPIISNIQKISKLEQGLTAGLVLTRKTQF